MGRYRYSIWDGTQEIASIDAEDVMSALSDDVLSNGDLARALRNLMQRGLQGRMGQLKGLRDLLEQLRAQRQQTMDRYDLGSIVDEIQQRLDRIVRTERDTIESRLDQARQQTTSKPEASQRPPVGESDQQLSAAEGGQQPSAAQGDQQPWDNSDLLKTLERIAEKKLAQLDQLPKDPSGMIKGLSEYDFMSPDARQQFEELMKMLQQRVMDSFFKDMQQTLQNITPEELKKMREMLQALNSMLEQKARGEKPDFDKFMRQYGQYFPEKPANLDELVENLQRRMAQMQSLMDSLSPNQRQTLQDLLQQSMSQDPGLQQEVAQLAATLEGLFPRNDLRRRYPFRGSEQLTLDEATRLMDELQQMDDLEKQLRRAMQWNDTDEVDPDKLRELLGEEAYENWKQLQRLLDMLQEAGYVQFNGSRLELTPRGMRKIGQKALGDIFDRIKKDHFGKHPTDFRGTGHERIDDSKRYEFGDPFHLHLERTIYNSLFREQPAIPLKLKPEDFEVYRTQLISDSSTVVMIDLSWSMGLKGNFLAAKKVTLALHNLIKTQFPRDSLHIIGFSRYARQLQPDELIRADVDEYSYGTNMHQAFGIARRLLGKDKSQNRQIIMVTDGEPTAHMEGKQSFFAYPPSPRTIQLTVQEVVRCTREGIVINTFMMDSDYHLMRFVEQLMKINRGRVFFSTADQLGQYILVDYLANKKKRIRS